MLAPGLSAAGWARASEHLKEIVRKKSDSTTELYDKFEKRA
jgi:hypothetical protein